VDGNDVSAPREVMSVLARKEAGEKISLRVLRNRAVLTLEITVPEGRVLDFLPAPPAPPAPPHSPGPPNDAAPPAPPSGSTTI